LLLTLLLRALDFALALAFALPSGIKDSLPFN